MTTRAAQSLRGKDLAEWRLATEDTRSGVVTTNKTQVALNCIEKWTFATRKKWGDIRPLEPPSISEEKTSRGRQGVEISHQGDRNWSGRTKKHRQLSTVLKNGLLQHGETLQWITRAAQAGESPGRAGAGRPGRADTSRHGLAVTSDPAKMRRSSTSTSWACTNNIHRRTRLVDRAEDEKM